MSLKVTAGKTIHRRTNIKVRLEEEEKDAMELQNKIEYAKYKIEANEQEIVELKKEIDNLWSKRRHYTQKKERLDQLPSISEYIDLKDNQRVLEKKIKTLERRINIAQPHYERAMQLMEKSGRSREYS